MKTITSSSTPNTPEKKPRIDKPIIMNIYAYTSLTKICNFKTLHIAAKIDEQFAPLQKCKPMTLILEFGISSHFYQ